MALLSRWFGSATTGEVHLLAYLACLLSVYRGRLVSDWGYGFAATRTGAPYSLSVDGALAVCRDAGLISGGDLELMPTEHGATFREQMRQHDLHAYREEYLDGACSSLTVMPVGILRGAIAQEPGLRRAGAPARKRRLLQEPEVGELYEHFSAIDQAVGAAARDLLVPAAVWIAYLAEVGEKACDSNLQERALDVGR